MAIQLIPGKNQNYEKSIEEAGLIQLRAADNNQGDIIITDVPNKQVCVIKGKTYMPGTRITVCRDWVYYMSIDMKLISTNWLPDHEELLETVQIEPETIEI